jgi:hypothetical protein
MIEMIKAATKDCKHDDCSITVKGATQTLVAHIPTFDKNGMIQENADPNTYSSRLECLTCGMKWDVHQRQNQLIVNPVSAE